MSTTQWSGATTPSTAWTATAGPTPLPNWTAAAGVSSLWDSQFDPGVAFLDGGSASLVQSATLDGSAAALTVNPQVGWVFGGIALNPWPW